MSNRWEDVEDLLVACAADDLESFGEVGPALVAFAGEQMLFTAWLRPFEPGAYHDAVIELLALAMPLDADRLALSISGRAWSLLDPILPATEDADLRQRVLVVHRCDGAGGPPRSESVVHPFDLDGAGVEWSPPQRMGRGESWLFDALEHAVSERERLRAPLAEIRRQAVRVAALGHDLYVSPALGERLARGRESHGGRPHAPRSRRRDQDRHEPRKRRA